MRIEQTRNDMELFFIYVRENVFLISIVSMEDGLRNKDLATITKCETIKN